MSHAPIVVEVDGIDLLFHGLSQGHTWNGWACPLFCRSEADRLMQALNATDGFGVMSFDEARQSYVWRDPGLDATDDPEIFEPTDIDGETYFAIGAYGWCWHDATDIDVGLFSRELIAELRAMSEVGIRVPDLAWQLARERETVAENLNMGVTGAADLIIQLAQI